MARGKNPLRSHIPTVLEFLNDKFKEGKAVSTLGVYRSAIADVLNPAGQKTVGNHPWVTDLFNGMSNIRPAAYKNPKTWKVENVLNTFRTWGPTSQLSNAQITYKCAMLIALTTGARCSETTYLDTKHMIVHEGEGIEFLLTKHKKARKARTLPGKLFIPAYRNIEALICPVSALEQYLIATDRLGSLCQDNSHDTWESDPIFRKTTKPYMGVTPKTISIWLTKVIMESENLRDEGGVMGHSTRGQAAKSAHEAGMSIKDIMSAAEWRSESVFKNYYHRPSYSSNFGKAVLSKK